MSLKTMSGSISPNDRPIDEQPQGLSRAEEDTLQAVMLQGVSRTFALTIPQLPEPLCRQVSNAYLLCRIIDTIEDEPAISAEQKRVFCQRFVAVCEARENAETFARDLAPLLSNQTIPAEHELIRKTASILRITHAFEPDVRQALCDCVRIMAEGMIDFQINKSPGGLERLTDMDRYCYHVAGVVGEMLTRLFCQYSPEIAKNREALMPLSVSFGQGLQMTNILKDLWDDARRGACWLPREVFAPEGYDLRDLAVGRDRERFAPGLTRLIGVAHEHLKRALTYVLLIPRHETGIRNFCLWALGMAVLTLRKVNQHKDFTCGEEVKITRRSVRATILATRLTVRHDFMLKLLFHWVGWALPSTQLTSPPLKEEHHFGQADVS